MRRLIMGTASALLIIGTALAQVSGDGGGGGGTLRGLDTPGEPPGAGVLKPNRGEAQPGALQTIRPELDPDGPKAYEPDWAVPKSTLPQKEDDEDTH